MRYEAQPNFYYCGPAAARNALSVQGKNISVDAMAKEMGTTEAGTNSINDITPVLNKETGKNDAYRSVEISTPDADAKQTDKLRADIVKTVDDGRAVVANIAGTRLTPTVLSTPSRAGTTSASSATATAARR